MAGYRINPDKKFYNFHGRMSPVEVEDTPAEIPPESPKTHPKLITDTTLRDGAQDPRFALFPSEAKLKYYDLLHELDNGTGTIEAIEVFIYQKRDVWVLEKLLERGYQYPQVTTWTRATPKDIKLLVDVSQGEIKETGMLASSSDHHIFDKLRFHSKEEAAEKYLVPILTAMDNDITPRVHLEDATKADIDGWVIPFMQRVLDETKGEAKFRVCDTIGYGIPDPHAAPPFGIPKLISTLLRETGAELEFHGHNDFGYATANSMAAFIYGCKRVNAAFGGLGERTGNASLEQIVANYIRLYGDPGFNLEALPEITELISRDVMPINEKQPIVGEVFTTQAGIHQSGIERQQMAEGGLIYLPFAPELVGRYSVEFNRIGALSGMDGIVSVLNRQVKATTGEEGKYTTASRVAKYIYDKVQEAYNGQYDEAHDSYVNYRRDFFTSQEILEMARSYEAEQKGA
ncbi:MAG: 2-isopropylmalate synthase [Dehalococcoidia bacterium]